MFITVIQCIYSITQQLSIVGQIEKTINITDPRHLSQLNTLINITGSLHYKSDNSSPSI